MKRTILVAAVALGACQAGPDARPDILPRPLHQPLADALADMPADAPARLVLWPERIDPDALVELSEGMDRNTHALAGLVSELLTMPGIDPRRPVLLAGFAPPDAAPFEAVAYGHLVDPEEAPAFLHGRASIPANNPSSLTGALIDKATETGMTLGALRGPLLKVSPEGALLSGRGMVIALLPQRDAIRLEIALGASDPATTADALALVAMDPAPAPSPPTPAWLHLLEGEGAAAVHLDMGRWATASSAWDAMTIRDALKDTGPEHIPELLARAGAISLTSASLMSPAQRRTVDITFSLTVEDKTPSLRVTRTLTDSEAALRARARQTPGTLLGPRDDKPMLTVLMGRSLREELAPALDQPTDGLALKAAIFNGGPFVAAYTTLNHPTRVLLSAARDFLAPFLAHPPESLSVVLDMKTSEGARPEPVLIAAGDYPTREAAEDLIKAFEVSSMATGIRLSADFRTGQDDRTTAVVAIGKTPREGLDFEAPLATQGETRARINLARQPGWESLAGGLFGALGLSTIDIVADTQGACHALSARPLRAGQAHAPTLVPTSAGLSFPPPSPGERCLIQASTTLATALEAYGDVAPDKRIATMEEVEASLSEALSCASEAPDTRDRARRVQSGVKLLSARLAALARHEEIALKKASEACELGRARACDLKAQLVPPFPAGALTLARVPWGRAWKLRDFDVRLSISNEGVYLDSQRLADLSRLTDPGDPKADWLGFALSGARPDRDSDEAFRQGVKPRADILMDRDTPFGAVKKVLRAATNAGFEVQLLLRGHDGDTRAFNPLLGAPGGAPVEADSLYLSINAAVANLYLGLKPIASANRVPDSVHPASLLMALSRAVQATHKDLGRTPIIHVVVEDKVSWSSALEVLGTLSVPKAGSWASVEDYVALIDGYDPFSRGAAPPTFILDEAMPAAGALGALNAAPLITSRPAVMGALDKEDIRRVIKANSPQIKACYERELIKDPRLAGKIDIRFTISPRGAVSAAQVKSSDMGSKAMESCLERVLRRMIFPAPRGGGIVIVSYPFTFNPAP